MNADVRDLLEGAARLDGDESVAAEAPWTAGRRRRTRRRAGGAVVGSALTLAAVGLVWQTGLVGGGEGSGQGVAAEFPDGGTTFVFAASGAFGTDPSTISDATPVAADDLEGTTWVLREELWRGGDAAAVVGSGAPTELAFGDAGWGVSVDACGEATAQGPLALEPDGAFTAPALGTTDIGCAPEVQAAEDFWMEALAGGGSIHRLGGESAGVLLVTVRAPAVDEPVALSEPPAQVTEEPDETAPASEKPDEVASEDPDEVAAPAPSRPQPTQPDPATPVETSPPQPVAPEPVAPEPTVAEPPSAPEPEPEPEPAQPTVDPTPVIPTVEPGVGVEPGGGSGPELPWNPPEARTEGGGGLAGGSGLYAPSLRAGLNDGFDRVVIDLTAAPGTAAGSPAWLASYEPSPTRDGSGAPAGVAGDSVLQLVLAGMPYPEPGDPVYDAGDYGLDTHSLAAVVEVIRTTPFEGQLQVFVGMQGEPRPYRVFVLENPLRLVVDIQTP